MSTADSEDMEKQSYQFELLYYKNYKLCPYNQNDLFLKYIEYVINIYINFYIRHFYISSIPRVF